MKSLDTIRAALLKTMRLPPDDLLRDAMFRRLWTSVLISSFGGQVTMLALPLTAAVLLKATPTQMGILTAMETLPFVLFSLPAGVWLDRVRKLPIYVIGESAMALAVAAVPVAYWFDVLTMPWLYLVGFVLGSVHTVAGSAAQIVLTQVVARERLVEAHSKTALAGSAAEVAGPGVAGGLIKLVGAPVALLVDAGLLIFSAAMLRGMRIHEVRGRSTRGFFADLKTGVRFVVRQRLLLGLAATVGLWQMCFHSALVVQILFATRTLRLSEQAIGLSYMAMGVGSVIVGVLGSRMSRRFGPGPALVAGVVVCALGWLVLAAAPDNAWAVAACAAMLLCFSAGAVLIFINFLSMRQAVTPEPLLGRMTSTMRCLILLPDGPGALVGGWLGEHFGLRAALGFSDVTALLISAVAWYFPLIRSVKRLPEREREDEWLGVEADVRPATLATTP